MERKNRPIFLASTIFFLAIFAFGLYGVQGVQAAQSLTQQPTQLIPPPPSAPYWTYTTGDMVRAVAVSEDGSTIVAGSWDKKLYVFDGKSSTPLWTFTSTSAIHDVAVSADGNTIVAGTTTPDGQIRVFSRSSNMPIWTYTTLVYINRVSVSADGNTIAACGDDYCIRVFGRQSGTPIWTYKTTPLYTYKFSVAVSGDGNTIVVCGGGNDHYVRVFGRQNNVTLWTYRSSSELYSVAISDDGNTIAACGNDHFIHVFSRQNNVTLWDYDTGYEADFVAVSRDGTTISGVGIDDLFKVFGRTSNTTLIEYDTGANVHSVAVSSDGSTIACGGTGMSPKAYLFSKSLGLLWSYDVGGAISGSIGSAVGISGDGSLIAYGCDDNKLYVFQYDTTPPVLGTASVTPSSPVGGQSINVSTSVTDNVEVSSVTLYYRDASSASWSSVAMSLTGSVYRANIGSFSKGSIIEYYVTAEDASGNTASTPVDAPLSYYTLTVGEPPAAPGVDWTSVLIGAVLGAFIAIIASSVLLRGKKGRS